MSEPPDSLRHVVTTRCEKCGAEIKILVDLSPVFATFHILTKPYRSFLERLHTEGRITDEELIGVDQTVQKLRTSMKYGYKDLGQEDESAPSTGRNPS